jgi:cold shock protein
MYLTNTRMSHTDTQAMEASMQEATLDPQRTGTPPPSEEEEVVMEVIQEMKDGDVTGQFIGQCKWFNNSYGYGFLTIFDGPEKGKDIFVHHSGIKPMNSMYKTLKKGEYVTFDIKGGDKGHQAENVRGICGGPLLCDHVQVKKTLRPGEEGVPPMMPPQNIPNAWNTVSYRSSKPRMPPVHPGAKRKRFGAPANSETSVMQA